jgi:hypothetical protein
VAACAAVAQELSNNTPNWDSSKSGRICPFHDKTWSKIALILISNINLKNKKNISFASDCKKFQNFSDNQQFPLISSPLQIGPNQVF